MRSAAATCTTQTSRTVHPRLVPGLLAPLLALGLCVSMPPTAAATITLLSVDSGGDAAGGTNLNDSSGSNKDMSPDGRFVLFTSTATDLVPGVTDTNNQPDGFVRDLQEGTTQIVSVDAAGNAIGTFGSPQFFGGFSFSPDSTRLVFRTSATNVVAGLADTNNQPDVFVRNLLTGETSCVSINSEGTSTGNSTSFTAEAPAWSPDGTLLAFISIAGDLVDGVTDISGRDLFLRNLETETTSYVSINTDGTNSGLATDNPAQFSPDGRYVAWLDMSAKLVDGITDGNNFTDLFVRDLQTNTTLIVSRTFDGKAALFAGSYEWSSDGERIVFGTSNPAVVAGVTDTNNLGDVFVWELDTQEVSIVSVSPDGTQAGDQQSRNFHFSPTGRFVSFGSASTNLTPESAGGDVKDDLYVRDLQTETTAYVARNEISSVVFGLNRFSPDGVHLLFETGETDVVDGVADTNGKVDVFLYDLLTGEKEPVTVNFEGTAMANTQGTVDDDLGFSPDGRYVSFVSDADDLVEDFTTTSTRDLFVRDLVSKETALVTVYINGGGAGYDQGATRNAEFSNDSRFLLFTDNALLASPVTTPFNFNFTTNLYAFDVVTHQQNLVSVNAANDAPANGGVEPFSFFVNPAGGSVAFMSVATDMVTGIDDTAFTYDLFLATLPTPATTSCGDPVPDAGMTIADPPASNAIKASDALLILRAAVGSATCELCVCDVDGSGGITASDALGILRLAVGQTFQLRCPAC